MKAVGDCQPINLNYEPICLFIMMLMRLQFGLANQTYCVKIVLWCIMNLQMENTIDLLADPARLLKGIILCLQQLLEESAVKQYEPTVFDLKTQPTLNMADYILRISKYMGCSLSVFICSIILIDRAQEYNPQFSVNKSNIHRLLLSSHVVAAKFLDDFYFKNSYYATIGGVSVSVLNQLESYFLSLVNFNCNIAHETFNAYCKKLLQFVDNRAAFCDTRETPSKNMRKQDKENSKKNRCVNREPISLKQRSSREEENDTAQDQF